MTQSIGHLAGKQEARPAPLAGKDPRIPATPPAPKPPAAAPITWRDLARASVPFAIVAGALAIYSHFGHQTPAPPKDPSSGGNERVTTERIAIYPDPVEIAVEGVARPYRHVALATEVAGRVRFKAPICEEASFVAQGTLLFEIDPVDYEIAVRRHANELQQTENALKEWQVERDNTAAQIKLAEEDVGLATRDVERLRRLVDSGGASRAAVEQAQRAEITARNTLLTLNNQLRLLDARYDRAVSARDLQQVALEKAQRDLARTKIVAPCDGTIVTENVEQDGYAQAGTTMVVMNDTSATEVQCQLEFDDMFWLWGTHEASATAGSTPQTSYEFPRWPVTVEFPFQDHVCIWEGELVRYGGAGIDPTTRTVPCQVHVAHPTKGQLQHSDGTPETNLVAPPLTVGMFVKVRARVAPQAPLLGLPADALHAGSVAWAVREGKLQTVPVKVARRLREMVLIYHEPQGLQLGDAVITSPLPMARDGMIVQEQTGS